MANKTVYPYGTEGSLPSSIGLINDLTTGGADKALTAEQGKILEAQAIKLHNTGEFYDEIDLSQCQQSPAYIASNGIWISGYSQQNERDQNFTVFIPVSAGKKYKIIASDEKDNYYAFLTSNSYTIGGEVAFSDMSSSRTLIEAGTEIRITIPDNSNATYLAVRSDYDGNPFVAPTVFELNSHTVDADSMMEGYALTKENVPYSPIIKCSQDFVGGGNKPFSAEGAKNLFLKLTKIGTGIEIDLQNIESIGYFISSSGEWVSSVDNRIKLVPVINGQTIKITPRAGYSACYTILASDDMSFVDFANGETSRHIINSESLIVISADDAAFLAVRADENTAIYKEPTLAYSVGMKEKNVSFSEIQYETTDIIATWQNYILRDSVENGTHYFYFSKDGGGTFVKTENTIGYIGYVHFYSSGRCLIAGHRKCYTTTDFVTFSESSVYDYDGSAFSPSQGIVYFFSLLNNTNELYSLDGEEVTFWSDYNVQSNYDSRIWVATDEGREVRCIAKNNETQFVNGETVSCRHFHDIIFDEPNETIYVTTGDFTSQNFVMKGVWNKTSGLFEYTKIDNSQVCWGQMWLGKKNFYLMTDGAYDGSYGILKASTDFSSVSWIWKTPDNSRLSSFWEDRYGNRVVFPDGTTYNKLFFADKNFNFSVVTIGAPTLAINNILGANINGDVVARLTDGYTTEQNAETHLAINRDDIPRFNLGKALRDAGAIDFGIGIGLV